MRSLQLLKEQSEINKYPFQPDTNPSWKDCSLKDPDSKNSPNSE